MILNRSQTKYKDNISWNYNPRRHTKPQHVGARLGLMKVTQYALNRPKVKQYASNRSSRGRSHSANRHRWRKHPCARLPFSIFHGVYKQGLLTCALIPFPVSLLPVTVWVTKRYCRLIPSAHCLARTSIDVGIPHSKLHRKKSGKKE